MPITHLQSIRNSSKTTIITLKKSSEDIIVNTQIDKVNYKSKELQANMSEFITSHRKKGKSKLNKTWKAERGNLE
jgi:ribosomal protein L17